MADHLSPHTFSLLVWIPPSGLCSLSSSASAVTLVFAIPSLSIVLALGFLSLLSLPHRHRPSVWRSACSCHLSLSCFGDCPGPYADAVAASTSSRSCPPSSVPGLTPAIACLRSMCLFLALPCPASSISPSFGAPLRLSVACSFSCSAVIFPFLSGGRKETPV